MCPLEPMIRTTGEQGVRSTEASPVEHTSQAENTDSKKVSPQPNGVPGTSTHQESTAGPNLVHSNTSSCPYHAPILLLQAGISTNTMTAIERYMEGPAADDPIAFVGTTSLGSSSSAGCTCGEISQEVLDSLTEMAIRDIVTGGNLAGHLAEEEA